MAPVFLSFASPIPAKTSAFNSDSHFVKLTPAPTSTATLWQPLLLTLILLATVLLYWQGLGGGFYLDDLSNLDGLTEASGTKGMMNFVFNNGSYRFLSYLSFLPHQADWINQNAFPFKLTNLLIHLLNTGLVFFLTHLICQKLDITGNFRTGIMLFCPLIWATAPIHASSVLYVIQRMTLLSTTFTLLACTFFLAREACWDTRNRRLAATVIIISCYFLGILAKENAVLIGVYLLTLQITLAHSRSLPRWGFAMITGGPLAITVIYLLLTHQLNYTGRDFTLTERLLTQACILFEYARNIILPFPHHINIFNDDHRVITGSLAIASIATIILLVILAFLCIRRHAVFSFTILWFLGGHLLESTVIPLELYFEHRNYLPAFGIIFLAVYLLVRPGKFALARAALLVLLTANILFTAFLETRSWGNAQQFALDAVAERPLSTRALHTASSWFLSTGDIRKAALLTDYSHRHIKPLSTHLINLIAFKCLDNEVAIDPLDQILAHIKMLGADMQTRDAIHMLFSILQMKPCQYINYNDFDGLLQLLQTSSPGYFNYYQMHRAMMFRQRKMPAETMAAVESMPIDQGTIDQGFFKIYMLLEYGKNTEAAEQLDILERRFQHTRAGLSNRQEMERLKALTSQ